MPHATDILPPSLAPRGLSRVQAAAYVGVSPNRFLAEVEAGLWPQPETRGRRKIWDRDRIDEAWDRRHQAEDETDPLMEALGDCET